MHTPEQIERMLDLLARAENAARVTIIWTTIGKELK